MKLLVRTYILPILLAVLASGIHAQEPDRPLGDHPLLDRFPDSTLDEIEVVEDTNYRLVLGTLQRNREVIVPEDSQRHRGDVTKLTYQVAQGFDGNDVQAFFEQQIAEKGYEVLFTCSGRACGSSNYWANDIFRNRILYGPERNQHFTALRVPQEEGSPAYISLYVITRANRRTYAYLEVVEENVSSAIISMASPELLEILNERGAVSLPSVQFASDNELTAESNLQEALELVQSDPRVQFYVVVHLDDDAPLDQLLARSKARAEFIKAQLVAEGVQADRLIAEGVGPLAPGCELADCAERVELVLR